MKRTQLITSADLTRDEVDFLIEEAEKMRDYRGDDLKGKICASLFFEPSTRTRLSFESAIHRLGGSIITISDAQSTSLKKGESLQDTIRVIEKYADVLVMRHPTGGSAKIAADETNKPFINAGDGGNDHPTQSLLEAYAIKREMGRLENLKIGFGFDPKHSRTIRGLAQLLSLYKGNEFTFVCPASLTPEPDFLKHLEEKKIPFNVRHDLSDYPEFDLFYSNRLQEERFSDHNEFEQLRKEFTLTKKLVEPNKAIVLNPLPRIDEIEPAVDHLPQAAYFRAVEGGVYMRMALLKYVVGNYYN